MSFDMSTEISLLILFGLIEVLVIIVLTVMGHYLKWLGGASMRNREMLVRIESEVLQLNKLAEDVRRLVHKQSQLDTNMATLRERQTGFEAALSSLQSVVSSITGHKKDIL